MDNTKWIYLGTHQAMGVWFDEYVSEDGTLGKHEWYDGYIEVYET